MKMNEIIVVNILTWVGVGILFLMCLPFPRVSKLILEVSAFCLRLLLLATLVGGAYLWFHPEMVSAAEVHDFYQGLSPQLQQVIPAPGTPLFGLVLAGLAVLMYLPVLAVLDVCRQLAGQRLRRLRRLSSGHFEVVDVDMLVPAGETAEPTSRPRRVVVVRGSSLHSAADTIAAANAAPGQHNRVADFVR
jgi:hypothetical protein